MYLGLQRIPGGNAEIADDRLFARYQDGEKYVREHYPFDADFSYNPRNRFRFFLTPDQKQAHKFNCLDWFSKKKFD
jgi:hypothetical protein